MLVLLALKSAAGASAPALVLEVSVKVAELPAPVFCPRHLLAATWHMVLGECTAAQCVHSAVGAAITVIGG
jgi:hypothetical protein